ncbi:uncharacterized protein K460DRAFT_58032 [Cucurbitaria berberidis CBS 394.84]|uniref:Uncharacterized protein n=1 Tax=Cucurbitaria berberidis CBS 394.84 TaxID=1168544 RepID=A0A9P4LAJ2_9PLEO|nr:uncharacterized protein K460DRAFT_58032 [Cucurbitaria berberidis CBS 394.84]KAF1847417.1 hypothetical protein K460DRAFT_58032 [Cucurbitaria berberidis CBS 394.84]
MRRGLVGEEVKARRHYRLLFAVDIAMGSMCASIFCIIAAFLFQRELGRYLGHRGRPGRCPRVSYWYATIHLAKSGISPSFKRRPPLVFVKPTSPRMFRSLQGCPNWLGPDG